MTDIESSFSTLQGRTPLAANSNVGVEISDLSGIRDPEVGEVGQQLGRELELSSYPTAGRGDHD